MKLFILGGTGNTGRRLIAMALACGHAVTAYVRSREKLLSVLGEFPEGLDVIEGDIADSEPLIAAMRGHDCVINSAGNAQDGARYLPLVDAVVSAAEEALPAGGRFWLFGGAAVLDVPGTDHTMLRFRQVPKVFQAHATNLARVARTGLDWSMLCPGPMVEAAGGMPHDGLRLSKNTWPVERPGFTKFLPGPALLVAFMQKMPELTITYEDAAKVILDHLEPGGPYSCARVGVALPRGLKLNKQEVMRPPSV